MKMKEKIYYQIQVSSINWITGKDTFSDVGPIFDNLNDVKEAFRTYVMNAKKTLDSKSAPKTTYRIVSKTISPWTEIVREDILL